MIFFSPDLVDFLIISTWCHNFHMVQVSGEGACNLLPPTTAYSPLNTDISGHNNRWHHNHFCIWVGARMDIVKALILSWPVSDIWISVISGLLSDWQQKRISLCGRWKLLECQLKCRPVQDGNTNAEVHRNAPAIR